MMDNSIHTKIETRGHKKEIPSNVRKKQEEGSRGCDSHNPCHQQIEHNHNFTSCIEEGQKKQMRLKDCELEVRFRFLDVHLDKSGSLEIDAQLEEEEEAIYLVNNKFQDAKEYTTRKLDHGEKTLWQGSGRLQWEKLKSSRTW